MSTEAWATVPLLATALCILVCWARCSLLLGKAQRTATRFGTERADKLETILAARIEAEEQAKAQAYCEGWEERRAFEDCLREEEWNAQAQQLKRMAN